MTTNQDSAVSLEPLLRTMMDAGASDLLLTTGAAPQFRVHGLLTPQGEVLASHQIQTMARTLLDEAHMQRLETERTLDFSCGFPGLARFRFNFYYQRDALAIATRIIPHVIPPLDELALPIIVKEFAELNHGLFLVTGPTGSGKSTTLAAMIDHINETKGLHVITIEDPIEYMHHHKRCTVDQREIGTDARSFDEALRSVFRQTPDVILVGEMRDLETMQLALTLAETGHLTLATLHTHDTSNAITRIVDAFPASQQEQVSLQLSLVLRGVLAQQLLPTRDGQGRVPACEVLKINLAVANLIREAQVQQIYSLIQTGRAEGMVTMNDSLKRLVDQQIVDRDTALHHSPRMKELARLL